MVERGRVELSPEEIAHIWMADISKDLQCNVLYNIFEDREMSKICGGTQLVIRFRTPEMNCTCMCTILSDNSHTVGVVAHMRDDKFTMFRQEPFIKRTFERILMKIAAIELAKGAGKLNELEKR